jgi:hypothetical protein
VDGVSEAAAATPSDVYVLLLYPRCCSAVSGIMVEHEGFVQELSDICDLWSWRRQRAIEDGDPKAWKVVRGWRIWRDLSTMSMGGGGSGARKARGRSPIDMPQRYVPSRARQARSLAKKSLMGWCFLGSGNGLGTSINHHGSCGNRDR